MVDHSDIDHTGLTGVGGSVATDAIWDAAGDLAVGSGANTAARLAKGNAGAVLAMSNGAVAWNAGTSFPGTPATGDRYFRTDRGIEYYYDGTRWLSVFQHILRFDLRVAQGSGGLAATTTLGNAAVPAYDMWFETARVIAFASSGAFDGTNFWTVTVDKLTTGNSSTNVASLTLNSQTSNNWKVWTQSVGALVEIANHVAFRLVATKSASAPNLFFGSEFTYRLVG